MVWPKVRGVALSLLILALTTAALYLFQSLLASKQTVDQISVTNELSCFLESEWLEDEQIFSLGNSSSPFLVLPPIKDVKYLTSLSPRLEVLLSVASSATFQFFQLKDGKEIPLPKDSISSHYTDSAKRFCNGTTSRHLKARSTHTLVAINMIKVHVTAEDSRHEEEYRLEIHSDLLTICVSTPIALRHALSTLSQLLDSPSPIPVPVLLHDWPDNPWRGLLVDVARHFQPLSLLRRTIDGMAAVKFNTLHLHLTDSQVPPSYLLSISPSL
jgi:hypothetical protein